MEIKEKLRTEYKQRSMTFTESYRKDADKAISDAVCASDIYENSSTVFIYISLLDEVSTLAIIEDAIAKGKTVCAPVILPDRIMEARRITGTGDLAQGMMQPKFTEPKQSCEVIPPEEIDLVLAPCITCDPYGNRLGYGGGYYDRYLKRLRDDARIIVLTRDRQLAMSLPKNSNDVAADFIATESGIKRSYGEKRKDRLQSTNVFLAATNNPHKIDELRAVLAPLGIEVKSYSDAGVTEFSVEETGSTFEENARLKASELYRLTGMPTISDDSGLEVDALDGAPGVYSARFSGPDADDKKNNEHLLNLIADVPDAERTARFVSVITAFLADGSIVSARGECEGRVAFAPSGRGGFGYDPLFIPDEYSANGLSFADITAEQKNQISHRARALEVFYKQLVDSRALTGDSDDKC